MKSIYLPLLFLLNATLFCFSESAPGSNSTLGVGLNIGARLFNPTEINLFATDMYWNLIAAANVDGTPVDIDAAIFVAPLLQLKATYHPIQQLSIDLFGHVSYASKRYHSLFLTSFATLSFCELGGGLDAWIRPVQFNRISPKLGFGALYAESMLNASGDQGGAFLGGHGFVWEALAGIDIALKRITINLDICVPFSTINYTRINNALDTALTYPDPALQFRIPTKAKYVGFEIRPGVVLLF